MYEALKTILDIQELDMQMIQLMRLKKERQKELSTIKSVKDALLQQASNKEKEILDIKKNIRLAEGEITELQSKFKKLESQQNSIKKVEEFNALSQEMSQADRDKTTKEQQLSEMYDRLSGEEDLLKNLKDTLDSTSENQKAAESEIYDSIRHINDEGRVLKDKRDGLVGHADPEVFRIYERLLNNKKDRVLVPIENRCCTGCHIMLTAQDENLVRKGEHLVFCEHCSRIHFWPETQALEGTTVSTKPRRRKSTPV